MKILTAEPVSPPPFAHGKICGNAAQRTGQRYEREIQRLLRDDLELYYPSPWFLYNGKKYCQPDGIMVDLSKGLLVIVEIKYKHCLKAWQQLHGLYRPVVRKVFSPDWDLKLLEICKTYEQIPYPTEINIVSGWNNLREHLNVRIMA